MDVGVCISHRYGCRFCPFLDIKSSQFDTQILPDTCCSKNTKNLNRSSVSIQGHNTVVQVMANPDSGKFKSKLSDVHKDNIEHVCIKTILKAKSQDRLESIKAAHKSAKSASSSRMEDYLEVIAELVEMKGYATTLDISRYMDVSAPSVTKMLQRLDDNGYLEYEKYHGINLTDAGAQIADTIRQKHGILLDFLRF